MHINVHVTRTKIDYEFENQVLHNGKLEVHYDYTGEEQSLVLFIDGVEYSEESGFIVEYMLEDEKKYSTTTPVFVEAGSYLVKYRIRATEYLTVESSLVYVIDKIDYEFE